MNSVQQNQIIWAYLVDINRTRGIQYSWNVQGAVKKPDGTVQRLGFLLPDVNSPEQVEEFLDTYVTHYFQEHIDDEGNIFFTYYGRQDDDELPLTLGEEIYS